MIQAKHLPGNPTSLLCSLKCLQLFKVSVSASNSQRYGNTWHQIWVLLTLFVFSIKCDLCSKVAQGMFHLTMSDSTIRNFCCYPCCLSYQSRYSSSPFMDSAQMHPSQGLFITRSQQKNLYWFSTFTVEANVPVISSVTSLAPVSQNATALKVCLKNDNNVRFLNFTSSGGHYSHSKSSSNDSNSCHFNCAAHQNCSANLCQTTSCESTIQQDDIVQALC